MPAESRPLVRHQTGSRTAETAREAYQKAGVEAELTPFVDDMAEAYSWADVVICRAGALTVAELSAAGLPAIFVPFPAAVDDHQTKNAAALAAAGAAVVLQERDISVQSLTQVLLDWLSDRTRLVERARIARTHAHPDALQHIADVCLDAAGVAA